MEINRSEQELVRRGKNKRAARNSSRNSKREKERAKTFKRR